MGAAADRIHWWLTGLLLAAVCVVMCKGKGNAETGVAVPRCVPVVAGTLPHPDAPFTQGLCLDSGIIYESHGLYGESGVRTLDTNGMVIAWRGMSEQFFGEGCSFFGGRLFQITWREQRCYVYSLPGLAPVDSLHYEGEGWGLCSAGDGFIMSNGSDKLMFRNRSFAPVATVSVTCNGKPLVNLNELEYARGRIYANVWYSDFIFEIDPHTGCVTRMIDCSDIVKREQPQSPDFVLNGIAFNPGNNRFYLTGKKWNTIYIVDIPAVRQTSGR